MMTDTSGDDLKSVEQMLAEVLGEDLADSLIRVAQKRGEHSLDMQIAINDGLESLPPEKRQEAITLIDSILKG